MFEQPSEDHVNQEDADGHDERKADEGLDDEVLFGLADVHVFTLCS